jgi:ribose transport system permease protein
VTTTTEGSAEARAPVAQRSLVRRARLALRRVPRLEAQLGVALALLYVVFTAANTTVFPTVATLQNLGRQGGVLVVVAIGQMAVLVVGGFDISVGANMGFCSTVLALTIGKVGLPAGVALGIAASGGAGLVNGILVAKFRVNPFITTLAMGTFLTGLSNQLTSGNSHLITNSGILWFGGNNWGPIPATLGIAATAVVIAYFLFNWTRPGLYIYAIGGSRETTLLSGVAVPAYEVSAYIFCGLLAGLGGVMLAGEITVGQASLGAGYELLSIAAAVVGGAAIGGGVGRVSGVVLGAAILTVLTNGLEILGVSEFIRGMITGAVLVAAVIFNRRSRLSGIAVRRNLSAWRSRLPARSPPERASR